jgi:ABC-type multidrug transport system permease subunit
MTMLGYDFPLLSMFWVLLWWFAMFAIFFAVIWAFIDNFRRHDHHGWAKAGWALLILIVPLLGTLIYLIARPADPFGAANATT